MIIPNEWDHKFLRLAKEIATWSKDPSTKIGAVAINSDRRILATGYNGFPRNIVDSYERLHNREKKYDYVVHAEQNCIYNASYNGISLQNSTLYVSGLPTCSHCARGIIQSGIRTVITSGGLDNLRWIKDRSLTEELFEEAGVDYAFIN